MAFTGFPDEAFTFFERLGADNSRTFWLANKATYDTMVRAPMEALLDELVDFGSFNVFRPYRDVRFAKDKTPYKEHIGAYGESDGGAGYYVHLSATGMFAGSGYYDMAADQLERFRHAVDSKASGEKLVVLCAEAEKRGLKLGAMSELKTAPRGYPKDHPRIAILRRKGLISSKEWPLAKWMHTKEVVTRVRDAWKAAADLNKWLNKHVGPSTLPPADSLET